MAGGGGRRLRRAGGVRSPSRGAGRLDEADFRALVETPGLRPRAAGGWTMRPRATPAAAPPAGRPGFVEGRRSVQEPGGRVAVRTVNLGESPIAWLAHRRDGQGRSWLTPAEAAAGERLCDDFHRAGVVGRLTMDWDAGPRGGSRLGLDPAERGIAAKARVADALKAVGPGLKEMLERVCLAGVAMEVAERDLRLPRRAGKAVLKLALGRLAAHYGVGP